VIESHIVECGELRPSLLVGSYPAFHAHGPEVEVVVKSSDEAELAAAAAWIEDALDAMAG